jgi:hypothetical protein
MKYKIVSEAVNDICLEELTRKINLLLSEGWRPQGGLVTMPPTASSAGRYLQAMVF